MLAEQKEVCLTPQMESPRTCLGLVQVIGTINTFNCEESVFVSASLHHQLLVQISCFFICRLCFVTSLLYGFHTGLMVHLTLHICTVEV